jgi:hypothetical protein
MPAVFGIRHREALWLRQHAVLCCCCCGVVLCSGWAAADSLVLRTFPILSGAWTPQFDMGHVISAVQANVFIVSSGG